MQYYQLYAQGFAEATLHLDLGALHAVFLAELRPDSLILDAGCGAGRDARIFREAGHRVLAFDASAELCAIASAHVGEPVQQRRFTDITERARYDAIWACASLLHVPEAELPEVLVRLWAALKPGGTFYLNFKEGEGERVDAEGRHFTDATELRARSWLAALGDTPEVRVWISPDSRPERPQRWLNLLLRKPLAPRDKLVTGGRDAPFLPHLSSAINRSSEIDIAVAFIKETGLREIWADLCAAIAPEKTSRPRVRVRVLTSDYLDVTDPEAFGLLELLQQRGAEVRVFLAERSSFHLKAYLFLHHPDHEGPAGTAFVGSSNLSRQALREGLEWNYRIDYPDDDGFLEARSRYDELFYHPDTIALTSAWIADYARRRRRPTFALSPGSDEQEAPPTPTDIQRGALEALARTRAQGHIRGLVVMATGLGKTWLAAFDAAQMGATRVLFLAHREEILAQAAATFLRLRPGARIGFYAARHRDPGADLLMASVQTLSRQAHLDTLDPERYDYIVVDEFHHAAASTYRRILRHVRPRFLLGLTASPDRTDQSDILSLCDDNLVYRCDLFDAVDQRALAPFHYYGIVDDSVDYQAIPWRNGRFDPEALEARLVTQARNVHTLQEWRRRRQSRTLAFCASRRHADHASAYFEQNGIKAAAVYGGSRVGRTEALEQLSQGRLDVIFSVDLFSEGVDVPAVDTVLMLRPTESKILFLQQLGRGLRLYAGKSHLVVLDFIANHKSFLHKPAALLNCSLTHSALAAAARDIAQDTLKLPAGCIVNFDLAFIDFMKALHSDDGRDSYRELRSLLGRRPTAAEFWRAGASFTELRRQHGSWFSFVAGEGDLDPDSRNLADVHADFLREIEVTPMTKSFKMVTLEAFQSLDGWRTPPTLSALAERAWHILEERGTLHEDLPAQFQQPGGASTRDWQIYWRRNPIAAWIGEGPGDGAARPFRLAGDHFESGFTVATAQIERFSDLVQELVDFRLARYEQRSGTEVAVTASPVQGDEAAASGRRVAIYDDLTAGIRAEPTERLIVLSRRFDASAEDPFVAPLPGMDMKTAAGLFGRAGGDRPVPTGGQRVYASNDGQPVLADAPPRVGAQVLAMLLARLTPLDLALEQDFQREEIPPLFGEQFNPGNWNVSHVVLPRARAHVLLVTLNKQGKVAEHRYHERWLDDRTFEWQTQSTTTPTSKRGRELIEHAARGLTIHLFVRANKLGPDGRGAAFRYYGRVSYRSHTGSEPMTVILDRLD